MAEAREQDARVEAVLGLYIQVILKETQHTKWIVE